MSGENPNPQEVSQAEVDAALAAAGAAPAPVPTAGDPAEQPITEQAPVAEAAAPAEATATATATATEPAPSEAPAQAETTEIPGSIPLDLPDLSTISPAKKSQGIELLTDVELNVKIELGRATMPIEDVLRLGEGSVVELDKLAGDPVDVLVNDRLVARGEVIVLNDNFCVRISEIVAGTGDVVAA